VTDWAVSADLSGAADFGADLLAAMGRKYSVIRRRPHVVDVIVPKKAGADGYRLERALNFDAAWTTIVTSGPYGYVDDSLRFQAHVPQSGDHVRIIFDPDNHHLDDSLAFWMRFVPVVGGVAGAPGNPGLILPDGIGRGVVIIAGAAPSGADATEALQLELPRLVEDLVVYNQDPAVTLYVSTSVSDAEYPILAGPGEPPFTSLRGATPCIRVRGDGASAAFSATFTLAFAR